MSFYQLNFGVFNFKIYGLFLTLAFIFASLALYKKVQQQKISTDFFIHHFWRWVIGAILFSRIIAVLLNPELIQEHALYSFFMFWEGGLNTGGLFIGFLTTLYLDLKNNDKQDQFINWCTLAVPPFLIGLIIADLGSLITGNTYGPETNLPWGIQYETFNVQILNPVHPVMLYFLIFHFWLLHLVKTLNKHITNNSIVGKTREWRKALLTTFFILPFLIIIARFIDQTFKIKHVLVRSDELLIFTGLITTTAVYLYIKKHVKIFEKSSLELFSLAFLSSIFWFSFLRADEVILIFDFISLEQIISITGIIAFTIYLKKQNTIKN